MKQTNRYAAGRRAGPWRLAAIGLAGAGVLAATSGAQADKVKNGTAVFSGLDKITGRIISFQALMGETVQFGSLKVTARSCFTRPSTEAPQTDSFVEVDEVSAGKDDKRIFSGWMFSASPGLHGIEHPVYDIWLTNCKDPGEVIADAPQAADPDDPNAVPSADGANPAAAPAPGAAPAEAKPKPKPKRVAKPAPPPQAAPRQPEEAAREPSQRFFPASQYPTDFGGRDPAGNKR